MGKADTLLVLGANLTTPLCSQFLQYYTGPDLILVTEKEHYSDQRADIIIRGRCDEFLAAWYLNMKSKIKTEIGEKK